MGSLGAPFILCPLSERKGFLGMSAHQDKSKVILTLSKNIAIRYHILEQKQETSWTSSRHWLTSPVIYNKAGGNYAAVMDNNTLALWEDEDTSLQNVKKTRFALPLWSVFPQDEGEPILVFENGFVISLDKLRGKDESKKALKNVANEKGCLDHPEKEVIVDFGVNQEREICVLLSVPKKDGRVVQIRKSEDIVVRVVDLETSEVRCTRKMKEGENLVGHCFLFEGRSTSFLYLTDSGKLYKAEINTRTEEGQDEDQLLSSQFVGSLGKYVGVKSPVVMRPAHASSVLVYGSDPGEEGATLFLYDLKYDLLVAKQGLKLYGNPPIMDVVGRNAIIPVGLHVLVVAIYNSKSLLSEVVGKHGIRSGEEVFEERAPFLSEWGEETSTRAFPGSNKKKPKKVNEVAQLKKSFPTFWEVVEQYKTLEKEGQPQALIAEQILPSVLEKKDALEWMLQTFVDIPENQLVAILSHLVAQIHAETLAVDPLLERIIRRDTDTKQLTHCLRSLNFEHVKLLCLYLQRRMQERLCLVDGNDQPDTSTSDSDPAGMHTLECCVHWLNSLLDSHYTHFVLNSEKDLVSQLYTTMEKGGEVLDSLGELAPFLSLIQKKVDFTPKPSAKSRWRTEVLTFV